MGKAIDFVYVVFAYWTCIFYIDLAAEQHLASSVILQRRVSLSYV